MTYYPPNTERQHKHARPVPTKALTDYSVARALTRIRFYTDVLEAHLSKVGATPDSQFSRRGAMTRTPSKEAEVDRPLRDEEDGNGE